MKKSQEVDRYISRFPKEVQVVLKKVRTTICIAAPKAEETMSYGIPTFKLNGNLVHFGGFKKHIGFFPTASGIAAFTKELQEYQTSKGTVRFPLDEEMPIGLLQKITRFRVSENLKKYSKNH